MATDVTRKGPKDSETVTLTRSDDWVVATHEPSGIASQGMTISEALGNLAEALELEDEDFDNRDAGKIDEPDTPWFE